MEFGLSEKEAKVYLALLELGMAPAAAIAQTAGVKRPSAYVILDNLMKQGFVSLAQDDNIQQYLATSPDIFLRLAEKRADRENNRHNQIKNLIPELKGLYKENKKKPKVMVFEGIEGLSNALVEGFNTKEKVNRVFTSGENVMKFIPDYIREWTLKRMDLGIELRGIYVDNKASRDLIHTSPSLYKVVFVPPEDYSYPVDMLIADNKIGYFTIEKNKITTVIIEGKEIGLMMRNMFDMAFEEAIRRGGKLETKL